MKVGIARIGVHTGDLVHVERKASGAQRRHLLKMTKRLSRSKPLVQRLG